MPVPIGQLHVSNGISIEKLIVRDVTTGYSGCQAKCIAVNGYARQTVLKIHAVRELYRTVQFSEMVSKSTDLCTRVSFCSKRIAQVVPEKERVLCVMTGHKCSVCGNTQANEAGESFHRIPKEPERRALWLRVFELGENDIKASTRKTFYRWRLEEDA